MLQSILPQVLIQVNLTFLHLLSALSLQKQRLIFCLLKLVNLLFLFNSRMPVEALGFAICHLPQIPAHIIAGAGGYTQLVIRRIQFLESQLQKNLLLNRNRLIKYHSVVTNKYSLHDI